MFNWKLKPREDTRGRQEATERIRDFSGYADKDHVYAKLETSDQGLDLGQVEERQDIYGENIITTHSRDTIWHRIWDSVINPFNVILLIIAGISYITDVMIAAPGEADYFTFIIILILVSLSSIISFIQSQTSSNAVAALTEMVENTAHVYREGQLVEIPQDEIVPGDLISLSAGDMLPADVRFVFTKDTFIGQAALTGESLPVEKYSRQVENTHIHITDLDNIGFMGTNIISGSARAVAIATGNDTYFGTMAESMSGERAKNSFERGVDAVSKMLIRMMIIMVPIVLLINGFGKGDWPSAVLFAVSIAVGLTPELLPVITTSTLARGAINMSKHKVIVRNMSSIQSFGEMDILCTDKTGTLTEDEIVLERYMDVYGQDDRRILRHAYLNSAFQTGLKNLIDLAIINRAEAYDMEDVLKRYTLVDEIPFDFTRRRMSVVLEDDNGKRQLITKGAVEEMLANCSFVELEGEVVPLTEETKEIALKTYEHYNHDGLRMLGVAQKNDVPGIEEFGVEDESDMVLIGFMGFLDPPKKSAIPAIDALKEHGVRPVVLTGDSEGVAIKVCREVGIDTSVVYMGNDVEAMSDAELADAVERTSLFAKLSPTQKERVVLTMQHNGHTVGFLGDGINDAPALRQADVGISVDNAVDIAKETADIILLEKDLMVLEQGVIEGRKTFGNIIKYIKMATSGNVGNIIAVIIASLFLPFLPMLPVQLLAQNLLNDFAQLGMPFDNVDEEYLIKPQSWDTDSIKTFMLWLGPISSIFDILCFAILWYIMGANTMEMAPLFQAGWFIFGTLSQVAIIHMIRTTKLPFIESMASKELMLSTGLITLIALGIAFSPIAFGLDMWPLPFTFLLWLVILVAGYMLTVELFQKYYMKRYGDWL